MLDYLRLGGVELHDLTTVSPLKRLLRAEGFTGPPSVRGQTWDRPEEHGVVEPDAQFLGPRLLVVEGRVRHDTVDNLRTTWNAMSKAFYGALSTDTLLTWEEGSTALQAYVRLAGDVLPSYRGGQPSLIYQVQFRSADPRLYDQNEQNSAAAASSSSGGIPFPIPFPIPFGSGSTGGAITCTNGGNVDTWPRYALLGPIVNPSISNTTRGETLYFDALTVNAGETLIVETRPGARSAMVAGTDVAGSIRWSDSVYPRLSAGSNTVTFTGGGTTGATLLTLYWRNAYI